MYIKNKKKYLLFVYIFFLLIFISSFSNQELILPSNKLIKGNKEYSSSDLFLFKDINNQPLLVQIGRDSKNKKGDKNIKICIYSSSSNPQNSIQILKESFFNKKNQNPKRTKFTALLKSISMTKADSLAEIKRFEGELYNNKKAKPAKSYKGVIQSHVLKICYQNDSTNKIKQIIKGSIASKHKLYQKKEFVFKKSKSTLKVIILEDRKKENYVLKLALEGNDKFRNNSKGCTELIGSAGDFSIPLGTFVVDALNSNFLYLPIEKELAQKILIGKNNYSIKFRNPTEQKFSEIRLNQF